MKEVCAKHIYFTHGGNLWLQKKRTVHCASSGTSTLNAESKGLGSNYTVEPSGYLDYRVLGVYAFTVWGFMVLDLWFMVLGSGTLSSKRVAGYGGLLAMYCGVVKTLPNYPCPQQWRNEAR